MADATSDQTPSVLPQFMQMLMMGSAPPQAPPAPQIAPQQSPMGPTSPVQPGGFDLASTVKQVSALPEYQQASGRLEEIGGRERDIEQKMKDMPIPQMGFKPHFGGGFFHNLGQALMALGASTAPGRAVERTVYGPDIRRYGAEKQSLAEQLATLRGEETIPTEELRATTGLTQAAGLAGYRGAQAETNRLRVQAYAQSIADRAKNFAATQDWRAASLDEKKRSNVVNEAQRAADEAGRDYRERNRDATMEEVAGIVTGTRQQIANEAAARDPSVKSWLFNALGIGVPQIQGAPSPETRPTPKAGGIGSATKPKKGVYNPATGQVEWK